MSEENPEVSEYEVKKNKRYWLGIIRQIHRRKLTDDGTEEPPELTRIQDIFKTKPCKQCGNPIKYPEISYCKECKKDRKTNNVRRKKRCCQNTDPSLPD